MIGDHRAIGVPGKGSVRARAFSTKVGWIVRRAAFAKGALVIQILARLDHAELQRLAPGLVPLGILAVRAGAAFATGFLGLVLLGKVALVSGAAGHLGSPLWVR